MSDSKKPRPKQTESSSVSDPLSIDDLDEPSSVDGEQVKGGQLPETHGCPKLPPRPPAY